MSILIIGGDRLGNIIRNLQNIGFQDIQHFSGRKKGHFELMRRKVDIVLVLVDFVSHELANKIKEAFKKEPVRVVFARRAWCHIKGEMDRVLCSECSDGQCPHRALKA